MPERKLHPTRVWDTVVQDLTEIVRRAARAGARAALEEVGHGGGEEAGRGKGGDVSLRGDLAAERAVVEELKRWLPSFKLVTEEAGELSFGQGGPVVVVDPLDGSRNYKRGIPFFATSVAAAVGPTIEDVVAAAVYAPLLDLEFYAERGNGAFLNGRKLSVKPSEQPVVAVNATPKAFFLPHLLALTLSTEGFVVRMLGAASLELAFVASGGVDAYLDPWFAVRVVDLAASLLVVRETGALVRVEGRLENPPLLSLDERMAVLAASTEELAAELDRAMSRALGFGFGEAHSILTAR
jgi:myo-inositol-1(or 4)-monophosphatase